MSRISLAINLLCFCTSSWGLWQATKVQLPASLAQAGHKQFLTNLSVAATLCNNICYFIAFLPPKRITSPRLRYVARQLTLPVALVLETVVAVIYWPLRLFFLPLIMHGVKDGSRMPLSLKVDCALHLYPALYLAADYFFASLEPFQITKLAAWLIITALGFGYKRYLEILIDTDAGDVYPYPFLDVAEPYRSGIFVIVTAAAWSIFCVYRKIHRGHAKVIGKKAE
ncbi:LAMI_0B00672g1_1 [Lachancea mirantina]|uniref:LAMI_0B00672g1_1 n=1 Tax=Lachancea mirantina TaxID=1230905 RepID=A0A1G4IT88_9SACH|nr:LAMI_0B00672g1_1 [Lachancea mirantina]